MIIITIGELISICSSVWFLFRYWFKIEFAKVFRYSLIYSFLYDNNVAKLALDKINLSLFYAFQTNSILMNSFLCLEMFYSLKYPISQITKRFNFYLILTYSATMFQFILLMVRVNFDDSIDNNPDLFLSIILYQDFGILFRIINIICFVFFIATGGISICYLILRFCRGSHIDIAIDLRNKFVTRHCFFVFTYLIFYLPLMINEFIFVVNYDIKQLYFIEETLIIFYLLPFAMFFTRSVETNISQYFCCLHSKKNIIKKELKIRKSNIYTVNILIIY